MERGPRSAEYDLEDIEKLTTLTRTHLHQINADRPSFDRVGYSFRFRDLKSVILLVARHGTPQVKQEILDALRDGGAFDINVSLKPAVTKHAAKKKTAKG